MKIIVDCRRPSLMGFPLALLLPSTQSSVSSSRTRTTMMNTSHPFYVNHFQQTKILGGCTSALHQTFEALLAVLASLLALMLLLLLGRWIPSLRSSPQSPKRGLGFVVDTSWATSCWPEPPQALTIHLWDGGANHLAIAPGPCSPAWDAPWLYPWSLLLDLTMTINGQKKKVLK